MATSIRPKNPPIPDTGENPNIPKATSAILMEDYAIEDIVDALIKLPDPDMVLEKFGLGRQDLRKLESDDEIAGALETRREAVLTTAWRFEPFGNADTQWLYEEIAPHVENILRGAWAAIPYGYSVMEAIYEDKGDGTIGLQRVQEKPLEWFEPRRDGTLLFYPPSGSKKIGQGPSFPVDTTFKFFMTRRNPTYRNPYGEALLSRAYWAWFFRYNAWRFWMNFVERFGDPFIMGKVHNPQQFVDELGKLGAEARFAIGVDEDAEVILQVAPGEFARLESALDRRIQKLILGQTLTTDVQGWGSYAAARVHDEVRTDKKKSDIRLVRGTVRNVAKALWVLNNKAGDLPEFVMDDGTDLSQERAERDAKLVKSGVLRLTKQYLLDRYDFEPGDISLENLMPIPNVYGVENRVSDPGEEEEEPEALPPPAPPPPTEDEEVSNKAEGRIVRKGT